MKHLLLISVAACGFNASGDNTVNDATGTHPEDANPGCHGGIIFTPNPATTANGIARATAYLEGFAGVPTYVWTVDGGTDFTTTGAQNEWVEFSIADARAYTVRLRFDDTFDQCLPDEETLNVTTGPAQDVFRLRVRSGSLPPQEHAILLPPGAQTYAYGDFAVSPALAIHPTLKHAGSPVPAYLKLMPQAAADEIVEAFAGSDGTVQANVVPAAHYVLVVPSVPGVAPQLLTAAFQTQPNPMLTLATGQTISGTVLGPTGAPLAGAHVQLSIGGVPDAVKDTLAGVPSTLTTTAADGTFSVLAVVPSGNPPITVDVVPPATSGLPRLDATGTFDPAAPLAVAYASTMAPHDLAGISVPSHASVTIVGAIANAGTVNGTVATGTVLATASVDATHHLTTLRAPPAMLSAVVDTGAVTAIDVASPPTMIDPPAAVPWAVHFDRTDGGTVPIGLFVDAAPLGALAATGAQPIHAVSTASGASFALPSGSEYELRISDPQNRVAPLTLPMTHDVLLPRTTIVTGTVTVSGVGAASNALVQVMCGTCTGVARARPLASTTTDTGGNYHYALATPP